MIGVSKNCGKLDSVNTGTIRHRAVRVVLVSAMLIVLGSATTVGVAWSLTYRAHSRNQRSTGAFGPVCPELGCHVGRVSGLWDVGFASYSATHESVLVMESGPFSDKPSSAFLPSWAKPILMMIGSEPDLADPEGFLTANIRQTIACGWPFLCFHCEPSYRMDEQGVRKVVSGGIVLGNSRYKPFGGDHLALPHSPIYMGLVANMGLYCVGWFALVAVPVALRQQHRARRGRCPKCGYDLRATHSSACCPECGRDRQMIAGSR